MKPEATAVCGNIRFSCKRSSDNIRQRYKVGRVMNNRLILTELEALYLLVKQVIVPFGLSSKQVILKLIRTDSDIDELRVYTSLKSLGLYVRKEPDGLSCRKDSREEYSDPVKIALEDSSISLEKLLDRGKAVWATVDDQGDITFFLSEKYDPKGSSGKPLNLVETETLEKRAIADNVGDQWMGEDFYGLRLLSKSEKEYLSGKQEDMESRVFSDLVNRGCIVKTGFKYGCNFRVYLHSMDEHAEILVSVLKGEEAWFKVSRAVRLAHGVRKDILFAGESNGKIQYVKLERIAPEYLKA